jgi:CRP-like cAMP-binding protein
MQYAMPAETYINSKTRSKLYKKDPATNEAIFQNPIYLHREAKGGLRNFLKKMPSFAQFTAKQLDLVETSAVSKTWKANETIFKQGTPGDYFYIVHKGSVEVLIQSDASLLAKGDVGVVVSTLREGLSFGERALMTSEVRAATIRAREPTTCLVINRDVYEDVLSNVSVLIHETAKDYEDFADDDETRSLFQHIRKITEIQQEVASPKFKRALYDLTTAFTPELSVDEITARMVFQVKSALKADRVGFFLVSEGGRSMILKVSERAKGVRLPVRGLAGQAINNNEVVNVHDAYQDSRFDATMDRRTGYRTRQVLCVPVRHPTTTEAIGALQVNNRSDGDTGPFSEEQMRVLVMAADQLSELIHGRADIFMKGHSGSNDIGVGAADGTAVMESATLTSPFSSRLDAIEIPTSVIQTGSKVVGVKVQVSLHLALQHLCPPVVVDVDISKVRILSNGTSALMQMDDLVKFDIEYKDVPRAARIMYKVLLVHKGSKVADVVHGWAASPVFDFKGFIVQRLDIGLFAGDLVVPIKTTLDNQSSTSVGTVCAVLAPEILMDTDVSVRNGIKRRLVFHTIEPIVGAVQGSMETFDEEVIARLKKVTMLSFNPMSMNLMTDEDKAFVWDLRYNILDRPEMLPCFVMSVKWQDAKMVAELYNILELWDKPTPAYALQLLDRRFMDPKVRAFAVHCLESLDDTNLALYMLQLCQQLKFENYVDSALSRFLIRRALSNPRTIGHIFFWMLKSELWHTDLTGRFVSLLQVYIIHAGRHRIELGQQNFVMKMLEHVAECVISEKKSKADRHRILQEKLSNVVLPIQFQLPLNPAYNVSAINVQKCRVMESKKKPLWLTMKNADYGRPNAGTQDEHIVFMLKVGDDLRQDALILQLLKVMDAIWRKEGLDMQMKVYDCISTGFERGLLQVVLDANTLGNQILDATDTKSSNAGKRRPSGGMMRKLGSAMRALTSFDTMKNWLYNEVTKDLGVSATAEQCQEEMDKRVQSFIFSSAAYCVASYVLGLGDRHNDNLMMTKFGHFFHIDFGHILGNFKYKLGIKRERAPFVFTHTMKAVMGDENFSLFVELCCDVYNILRENSGLLVSLVSLAIPCELPELQDEKDVQWLYDKLLVGKTDDEASEHFKKELDLAIKTVGTRINDAAHMIAHA